MEKHSFACLKTLEIEEHLLSEQVICRREGKNNSCYKLMGARDIALQCLESYISEHANIDTIIYVGHQLL